MPLSKGLAKGALFAMVAGPFLFGLRRGDMRRFAVLGMLFSIGCATWRPETRSLEELDPSKYVRLTLADSTQLIVREAHVVEDTLFGVWDDELWVVPVSEIASVQSQQRKTLATAALIVVGVGVIGFTAAMATVSSFY